MNEIEVLIYGIKSAREFKMDSTIPFDISHIVLNALQEKQERDNMICPYFEPKEYGGNV